MTATASGGASRVTTDLDHLRGFRCLQLTVEHAQNLRNSAPVASVFCRASLLSADDSVFCNLSTPAVPAQDDNPQFDSRMLLPYRAQRRLQLTVCDAGSGAEIGSYTLDLSPFSESKKSLAAKMKLKNLRQEDAGFLHVRVKMSSQEVNQPTVVEYSPYKNQSTKEATAATQPTASALVTPDFPASWKRAIQSARSIYIYLLEHSKYRTSLHDAFVYYKVCLGQVWLSSNAKSPRDARIDALYSYPYHEETTCKIEAWQVESQSVDRMLASHQSHLPELATRGDPFKAHEFIISLKNLQNEPVGEIRCFVGLSESRCLSAMCEMNASIEDLPVAPMKPIVYTRDVNDYNPTPSPPASPMILPPTPPKTIAPYSPPPPSYTGGDENDSEWLGREIYAGMQLETPAPQYRSLNITVYCVEGVQIPYALTSSVGPNILRQEFTSLASSYLFQFPYSSNKVATFEVHDGKGREVARRAYDLSAFLSCRGNILDGNATLFSIEGKACGRVQMRLEKKVVHLSGPSVASLF